MSKMNRREFLRAAGEAAAALPALIPESADAQGIPSPNLFDLLKTPGFSGAKAAYSSYDRSQGKYVTRMISISEIEGILRNKKDATMSWGFTECLGEDRCPLINEAITGVGSLYGTGYGTGQRAPDGIASLMVSVRPVMNGADTASIERFIHAAREKNTANYQAYLKSNTAPTDIKHDIIAIFPTSNQNVVLTGTAANLSINRDPGKLMGTHSTVVLGFDKAGKNVGFIPASLRGAATKNWQAIGFSVGRGR